MLIILYVVVVAAILVWWLRSAKPNHKIDPRLAAS